jgi:hypothetical protein
MMATPESIAAPREITELNPLMDLLRELNPALQNDPVFQKISGAGGFLKDLIEDPFNYLGGGAGAGLKGASVFLLARRAELEDLIKAVDTDPLLKGNQGLKNSYKKELDEVNQKIASDTKLKTQADEMMADPSKFGVSSGERTAKNLSLDRFDKRLFHGSDAPGLEKGLGSLKLFDDAGALYLAGDKADPRLSGFAAFDKTGTGEGSVYTVKPTFKKTFDTPGVKDYNKPEEIDYIREYLKSKNKNQATQGLMGIKQAITPLKNYRIGTHVPPQVDREFADFFQDMGYDSLRFRGTNRSLDVNPKTGLPYRDQSETIMSLSPEDSLEILNEMSFSDYIKYLRDPNIPK